MSANDLDPQTEPGGVDRRSFLGLMAGGLGGAAMVGITAAAAWPSESTAARATSEVSADHAAAPVTSGHSGTTAEMDAMHKEGIDQFLANVTSPITKGRGATELEWRMEGGVRVFELTCSAVDWEVAPGKVEKAMAYNGMVPGPTLRVVEGQTVRVHVRNELDESTSVHWHGQRVPNAMDGVPFMTQPPIEPGGTFTYEFVPSPFGSHMYHSHHNAAEQVSKGLLGALIVEPADRGAEPTYDKDYLYILNDVLGGFTINGKGFPATDAYTAKLGERVRFRFINEGLIVHPIHLHGLTFEVFARDGYPLPQPFRCDTITVAPGERWDAIVVADNPGTWAFHCHILSHAESPQGMFGMVSALIVEQEAS
jgi:FtsP/CotA-like multicopper oxidase with cupredoxin domain